MHRQSLPELLFDPDMPAASHEIRTPVPSLNHDMRTERNDSHEQTTYET